MRVKLTAALLSVAALCSLGCSTGNRRIVTQERDSPEKLLRRAAQRGDKAGLERILSQGVDLNAKDRRGFTALHWAAMQGHINILRALLAHGASLEVTNEVGETPLWEAAFAGKTKATEFLIGQGANVTAQNHNGETVLHAAVMWNHCGMSAIKLLLERGASLSCRTNEKSSTPLHYAALFGTLDSVKLLLVRGAEIDALDSDGESPLFLATQAGRREIVEYLLAHKASPNGQNKDGDDLHRMLLEGRYLR